MKYRTLNGLVIFIIAFGTLAIPTLHIHAATTIRISNVSINSYGCNFSIDMTFTNTVTITTPGAFANIRLNASAAGGPTIDQALGGGSIGPGPLSISDSGFVAGSIGAPLAPNTQMTFRFYDAVTGASAGVIVNCTTGAFTVFPQDSAAGGVQFFNPGDDRVDPHPGDRLAVWCNQRDKIVLYGVADDRPAFDSGFYLATFSYKALKAAGPKGLTQQIRGMGSVSVSIIDGWFWIAWNGGKYNATGKDIFVKNFEDSRWCERAHPTQ